MVAVALALCFAGSLRALGQADAEGVRSQVLDPQYRDRYVEALRRNPFQDRAFDAVFSSYFASDGIEAWIAALEAPDDSAETQAADLILLGRIRARLFETNDAIDYLERVEGPAAQSPEFSQLLGSLYADAGRYDDCIVRLNAALEALTDPDQRAETARVLGDVLMRTGRADEAAETWNRIAEDDNDVFALLALAELHESNQKWAKAIETHQRIFDASPDDPYRQCRELRAIGDLCVRQGQYAEAAAAFEQALALVAPANWLFTDIKQRLIGAYEAWENLPSLADYLTAKIEANPSDVEFRVLLAETQRRLGRIDDAAASLHAALERAPGHLRANEALVDLFDHAGRTAELQRTLADLVARFPLDPDYRRRLGDAYFQAGDTTKAIETWRAVVGDDTDASGHALLAGWFERAGLLAEAIQEYQHALTLEDLRDWRLRLADLHFQNGQVDDAVQVWTSTLNPAESTAADYAEVATLLAARELLDDAEQLLRKAIELDPDDGPVKLSIAKLLVRQGRFEDAVPYFTELAEQDRFAYLRDRGIDGLLDVYSSLGDLQTKKNEWEAALAANPDALPVLSKLAKLEVRMGNKRSVITLYRRCAELAPDDAEYRLALARAYRANEQPLEAIAEYKTLIDQNEGRAAGYYRELASLCAEEGYTDEAVAIAQAIVQRAPADSAALRGLARAYAADNQSEEALGAFRKALQLNPGDAELLREYGDLLAGFNEFGGAQEAYRSLLGAAPNDRVRLEAVRLLAELYREHERADELVREFRMRAERMPDDALAREELAAVYSAIGEGEQAVDTLEDALRLSANEEAGLRKLLRAAYEANDLEKVIAVHRQLEALQGSLSPRERERLGVAFARLGEYRKALDAWNVLYEERPGNSETLESLARTMREEGFHNRALKVSERALSLDPYNYALRYRYAVRLALADQWPDAIEQLRTILELEDEIVAAPENETRFVPNQNESVLAQQRQGLSKKPPLAMLEDLGKNWQGTFGEFRRVVIFGMMQLAREMGTMDRYIEEFRGVVDAEPRNSRAKEDLLIAYQAGERWADALAIADRLANEQPDNLWLLREMGLMRQRSKRIQSSIERQDEHMRTYPESWIAGSLSILPLLFQEGDVKRGHEIADQIFTEYADNVRILHPLASVMRGFGSADDVVRVYERILELDPADRGGIRFKLGRLHEHQEDFEAARTIYEELLFGERTSLVRSGQMGEEPSRFLPNGAYGVAEEILRLEWDVDIERMQAFDALVKLPRANDEPPPVFAKIASVIEGFDPDAGLDRLRLHTDLGKLMMAYYFQHDRYADAWKLRAQLLEAGCRDADMVNLHGMDDPPTAANADSPTTAGA